MVTWAAVYCRYDSAKKKGQYDEETQIRENAKHALERYMHYYQRYAENDKARVQVLLTYPSCAAMLIAAQSCCRRQPL